MLSFENPFPFALDFGGICFFFKWHKHVLQINPFPLHGAFPFGVYQANHSIKIWQVVPLYYNGTIEVPQLVTYVAFIYDIQASRFQIPSVQCMPCIPISYTCCFSALAEPKSIAQTPQVLQSNTWLCSFLIRFRTLSLLCVAHHSFFSLSGWSVNASIIFVLIRLSTHYICSYPIAFGVFVQLWSPKLSQ